MPDLSEILDILRQFIINMGLEEILGTLAGLVYIFFSVLGRPICWPFGIFSVTILMVLGIQGNLYMDALLQFIYVVLGFYGWQVWLTGGEEKTEAPIRRISRRELIVLSTIGILAIGPVGYIYAEQDWAPTAYPWWDTVTTVLSILAMVLLSRKVLENWILWVIANPIYIVIYWLKDWKGYSLLMVIYTVMAFAGLWNWIREYRQQAAQDSVGEVHDNV